MITSDVNEKGDGDEGSVDNGKQFVMSRPVKRQQIDIGYKGHKWNAESSDIKSSDAKSGDAESSNVESRGLYNSDDRSSDDKSVKWQKVEDNQLCFMVYPPLSIYLISHPTTSFDKCKWTRNRQSSTWYAAWLAYWDGNCSNKGMLGISRWHVKCAQCLLFMS